MKYLFLSIVTVFLLSNCRKTATPYSIFIDSAHQTISEDTIHVQLNESYELLVRSGYEYADPTYYLRKNADPVTEVSTSNILMLEAYGWDQRARQKYQTVRLPLTFNNIDFSIGDQLAITVHHSDREITKIFAIQ